MCREATQGKWSHTSLRFQNGIITLRVPQRFEKLLHSFLFQVLPFLINTTTQFPQKPVKELPSCWSCFRLSSPVVSSQTLNCHQVTASCLKGWRSGALVHTCSPKEQMGLSAQHWLCIFLSDERAKVRKHAKWVAACVAGSALYSLKSRQLNRSLVGQNGPENVNLMT